MATIGSLLVNLILNSANFLRQLAVASNATARASRQMQTSMAGVQSSFARTGRSLQGFVSLATTSLVVKKVIDYSDAWKMASNQLAAASEISGKSLRSTARLNEIAAETRTSLAETAELYARMARSTANLAVSEEDVARATEIANKAFKAGGASVQETVNGIRQLGQSLASGIFQGDELRSIRENAPLLAKAIADEFNTTIGGLKKLGAEGKLTADRVFKAILKGAKPIEDAFAATNATIAESFTVLNNSITQYVGEADKASGVSGALTDKILELAKALRDATADPAFAATGMSDITNMWNDFKTILALVNKELKERELVKIPEITDKEKEAVERANNAWKLIPEIIRQARLELEHYTEAVRTFESTQTRTTGGHAFDMLELARGRGLMHGGRGFEGPGVGGQTARQAEDARKALVEWREEVRGGTGDLERLTAAAAQGEEVFKRVQDSIAAETALRKAGKNAKDADFQFWVDWFVQIKKVERGNADLIKNLEELDKIQGDLSNEEKLQEALRTSTKAFDDMRIHVEALNMVLEGKEPITNFEHGLVDLAEQLIRTKEATGQLVEKASELPQLINSTVNSAISSMSSAFADAVVEGEKMRDMLDALLKDLAKLAINSVMNLFLRQILGSVSVPGQPGTGTGLLGGFGFHGGGVVGREGSHRSIPSGLIAGAPRFHAGLMSNEFAAVLKKGEGVFTPEQMKAMGGNGGSQVNINIIDRNNSDVKTNASEKDNGDLDIELLIDQVAARKINQPGSAMNRSLNQMGVRQGGIRR